MPRHVAVRSCGRKCEMTVDAMVTSAAALPCRLLAPLLNRLLSLCLIWRRCGHNLTPIDVEPYVDWLQADEDQAHALPG
ncbi:unnamed protein product [Dibothriocephalus latus]|uniref:Uncharacterized protein n=1 Tax=Dibothriocephalus latus TaxID=60516 RepID=A0A3P6TRD4_DIBLA|nr:unnamed protein product [Dibothriocephalus latus]